MKRSSMLLLFIAALYVGVLSGCTKKQVKKESLKQTPSELSSTTLSEELMKAGGQEKSGSVKGEANKQEKAKDELTIMAEEEGRLLPIHFDFDKYFMRDDAKLILDRIAEWLKKNQEVRIRIQGHCDEWGSNGYNLALGDRRAQSTKKYLVAMGIDDSRLSTISYGEERPVDAAHNKDAWAKNRRAEFEVLSK